jgi:hypothetical protein
LQEFIHKQIDRIDCKNHTLNAWMKAIT